MLDLKSTEGQAYSTTTFKSTKTTKTTKSQPLSTTTLKTTKGQPLSNSSSLKTGDKEVRIRCIDNLGYQDKCCKYVPLKPAVIMICLISFFWVTAELVGSQKFIARIDPAKSLIYRIIRAFFIVIMIGFAVVSGFLMVGILTRKYMAITVYVYYSVVLEFFYIPIYAVTFFMSSYAGKLDGVLGFRGICAVLWHCLFWYFLVIVNSFRKSIFEENRIIEEFYSRTTYY